MIAVFGLLAGDTTMLKKTLQKLKELTGGGDAVFDPSGFNDPIAMQTAWTPAKGGGANFRTHKLVTIGADRIEFKASLMARIFYLIFLVVGLGVIIAFSVSGLSSGNFSFDFDTILPLAFGAVFAVAGGVMFYFGTLPVIFDRRKGFFWKGRTAPDEVVRRETIKHYASLDQIHALQLISEYCRGNKSSYYSYELNLILKNGDRVNVIDHGSHKKLREDAGMLAAFLGVPVWDAI